MENANQNKLRASKEVLAKIISAENLRVIHRPTSTAAFDPENRILILPIWKKTISSECYTRLVCHEVGHALFTSADLFERSFEAIDPTNKRRVKGFVNIVEDVRIEKLMKGKFPGSKNSFKEGYKFLLENNLGSGKFDGRDVNTFPLIDRINVFFKGCGQLHVNFSEEEMVFVRRAVALKTEEEVIQLAKDLYEFTKEDVQSEEVEENEEEENSEDQNGEGADSEETEEEETEEEETEEEETENGASEEENEEDSVDSEEGEEEDSEEGEEEDSEEDSEEEADSDNGKASEGLDADDDFEQTEEFISENMEETADLVDEEVKNEEIKEVKKPELDSSKFIQSFDSIAESLDKYILNNPKNQVKQDKIWKSFDKETKETVNFLVGEFNRKKQARALAGTRTARSGTIDLTKIYKYKVSDDIFSQVKIAPNGTNHGFVFIVDWSGSMAGNMFNTAEQLVILLQFCKRINVPFDVYAFSDLANKYVDNEGSTVTGTTNYRGTSSIKLMHLSSGEFQVAKFNKSCKNILLLGAILQGTEGCARLTARLPYSLQLGGTPLNSSLMVVEDVVKKFRARHNVEIMNLVTLTDGFSTDAFEGTVMYSGNREWNISGGRNQTGALLSMIKDLHDVNVIGFFLQPWLQDNARYLIDEKEGYDVHFNVNAGLSVRDVKKINPKKETVTVESIKEWNASKKDSKVLLQRIVEIVNS
jgi:hypothetical protein